MSEGLHPRHALLRLSGEVGTKARATRRQFRDRLAANVRDALATLPGAARLTRVFGLQSISWVDRRPISSKEDVLRTAEALFREAVRGRRFAVRARRVGNKPPGAPRSSELNEALGTALRPLSAGVDLSRPEVTLRIELAADATSFFTEQVPAPGGLPLGVEGSAISLISGGFDSAAASWLMLKRGVALDYVFCNLGGPTHLQGVVRVAKHLADQWSYGDQPRLHAVDFEPVAEALQKHTEKRYWQVLLKRSMLRAASGVGRRRRAPAIVTGDAVGQVSSQTLQNLTVVSRATDETVLRPLVGFNKDEIVELTRRIGSFDLSSVVGEYCALVPRRPSTRAALEAVEREEAKLPADLVERAVASRTTFDLRTLDLASIDQPDLAIEHLPNDAVLLDLRPLDQYRSQHHPKALHLEFAKAMEAYASFDRARTYVLTCQFGLLSAHLADRMRRDGFRVHYLRAGTG
jgi:thiamine biosynthesis protein ThiI